MSGGGSKAPQGYQPTGQAQADQGYQNLVASQTPWANALPQQVIPGLQQVASNVANNPYYAQAQQGAQQGAQVGQGVAGQQVAGANNLSALGGLASSMAPGYTQGGNAAGAAAGATIGIGNQAAAAGQQVYGQTQKLAPEVYDQLMALVGPTTMGGLMAANPTLFSGLNKANQSYDTAMGAIPGLTQGMGAANQVLNTGFDPQQQLYNRQFQQQQDQTNATNAMYGLSSSPYGAGVANDASKNFNIDWQNQQLQRQISALGAYGAETGQITSNLTNLLNTGAGTYNSLSSGAVNNYTGLTSNAANNAANLTNSATGDYTNLAKTGFDALNTGLNTQMTGVNDAVTNYNALLNGDVSRLGQLTGTAGTAATTGSQLGQDAIKTLAESSSLPNATFMQQQQNQIAALQALSQGTTQALAPNEQLIADQGKYLGIGQQATQNAQNAVNANNQNASANAAGWGQLVGTAVAFLI